MEATSNRWGIAVAGTVLQLCLGTVYAWSFFQKLLVATCGWSHAQVAWTFSITIGVLGLAAAWGGMHLPKYGPRKLAMVGGLLFGLGYLVGAAALHLHALWLLYLGYGVIGGAGIGLGYVTPVATVANWFPDRKGLVTGMVIMGFGLGALLMSKLFAPLLIKLSTSATHPDGNLVMVFAALGVLFMLVTAPVANLLRNPPAGYAPPGWPPPAGNADPSDDHRAALPRQTYLVSGRFAMMWLVFFCNIVAGISIISFQSPLVQELYSRTDPSLDAATLASYGATLIAVSSLFNGLGRFFWGGVSDRIGRVMTFRIMLLSQVAVFAALMFVPHPLLFGVLVCYVLLCYGGGFGSMPSFVLDVFGPRMMAVVYGSMLTAWSAGGIIGPQVIAVVKDRFPDHASQYAFGIGAGFLLLGFVVSLFLRNTPFVPRTAAPAAMGKTPAMR